MEIEKLKELGELNKRINVPAHWLWLLVEAAENNQLSFTSQNSRMKSHIKTLRLNAEEIPDKERK